MQRLLIEPPVGGVLVEACWTPRFWTRILRSALFIGLDLPADQVELRAEAQAFFDLLRSCRRVDEAQSTLREDCRRERSSRSETASRTRLSAGWLLVCILC